MSTATTNRRDQRIADDAAEDQHLLCSAQGCPCRWSIDNGKGRLCTNHAAAAPARWPEITRQLKDAEVDRAMDRLPFTPPAKVVDKAAAIAKLRGFRLGANAGGPKDWAHQLAERERRGENLTLAQRTMWREALGVRAGDAA